MAQVEVTVYFNEISQQVMSFDSKLILLKATGDATTPTKLSYYGNQTNPRNPTSEYVVTEDIDTIVSTVGCALVSTNIWPSNATESIQYAFPSAGWQITDVSGVGIPNVNSIICYRYSQYNSEDTIDTLADAANACGGGGTYTADNGLSESTATNFQFGGPVSTPATLLDERYIDAGNFGLTLTSTKATQPFNVINDGDGGAIKAIAVGVNAPAILGQADTGAGIYGTATNGTGTSGTGNVGAYGNGTIIGGNFACNGGSAALQATAGGFATGLSVSAVDGDPTRIIGNRDQNNIQPVLLLSRGGATITPTAGLGGNILMAIKASNGSNLDCNSIIWEWTDPTQATITSKFTIQGHDSGTLRTALVLSGSGLMQLSQYGAGTLTSDASGNITASSDERFKDIQGDFNTGLEGVLNLHPILFKYNEESGLETEHTYAGFSAQNVKEHIPFGTGEDSKGYLSLQDRAIMAALVNSIKELKSEIEYLKNKL